MSASVLVLVMEPHLRNERFFHWLCSCVGICQFVVILLSVFCLSVEVYRSMGTWSLPHHHPASNALHVLVYNCIVSKAWLFVTTLLISCCLICHQAGQLVKILKLVASSTRTQRHQVSLLIWFASSDFSFLDSFLFTSVHCSPMEYWMLPPFHPFFSVLQFCIFCIVQVQPFFFSFDVETSLCHCGKWCSWARS